jgi:hypothetical protein
MRVFRLVRIFRLLLKGASSSRKKSISVLYDSLNVSASVDLLPFYFRYVLFLSPLCLTTSLLLFLHGECCTAGAPHTPTERWKEEDCRRNEHYSYSCPRNSSAHGFSFGKWLGLGCSPCLDSALGAVERD